jgi:hypothetical protein
MFQKYKLKRFMFLVEKKQSADRQYMLQSMQAPSLKWAPRDCSRVWSTYADFRHHGFDSYEVALSLVGRGKAQTRSSMTARYNPFARSSYTYLHMPFRQLADFLTELHPDDRFIAYVMTEEATPVHMYFDIDADLDKFPYLAGADEECIRVFMAALGGFFESRFRRALDVSGLLLLQATSATKLSWHLHIRSESFRDITHHKQFVEQFREWLEQQQELSDAEAEAAPEADPELDIAAEHRALPLCHFKATGLQPREGRWEHIVDLNPYSKNQNLRAPYNRKPGKTPLRMRTYEWDEYGELRVLRAATEPEDRIDPEVLFQAHPSLALPCAPGYVPLVADRRGGSLKRGRKRTARDAGSCGDDRKDDWEDGSEAAISGGGGFKSRKKPKWKNAAASESKRTTLTDSEVMLVRTAVTPHLGVGVQFDEVYRLSSRSVTVGMHGGGEIRGTTTSGTSECPILRARQPHRASMTHRSNRMCFTLSGEGWMRFHCFDEDCCKHDQTIPWPVDTAALRLLSGTDGDESDGDAQCTSLTGAFLGNPMSIGDDASESPATTGVTSAAAIPRATGTGNAAAVSAHRVGLHEGWTDGSSSSLARIRQQEHEALQSHRQEEEDKRQARQRYEQQVREADGHRGCVEFEEAENEEMKTSDAEAFATECVDESPAPSEPRSRPPADQEHRNCAVPRAGTYPSTGGTPERSESGSWLWEPRRSSS